MIKRIFVLAACIIVLSSTISVSSISISQKKETTLNLLNDLDKKLELSYDFNGMTIYVDDDNTVGPWNGTQDYPYQNIQDGVNNASENDTVFVCNGNYHESIVIRKTLRLTGEDKNNTIINAGEIISINATIDVSAENVEICGFTIKNILNGGNGFGNIGDNCTIHDNIITNTSTAILLMYCENCHIYQNNIKDNGLGIVLAECMNNIIDENLIEKNMMAIWTVGFIDNINKNNDFALNRVKNNSYCGIGSYNGEGNRFYLNDIEGSTLGISIQNSKECTIAFNNVKNNGKDPIAIDDEWLNPGGILIKNSSDAVVKFNNIENNVGFGLNSTNSTISCTWNYWGSVFGPSRTILELLGDRIIDENSVIEVFPWLPFRNPLAGYDEAWGYEGE